jgi:hypothetical protein
MKPRTRIATLAAIAGGSLLGISAPALASDFRLTLSGPSTTTVGQPTVFHIDGTNPPPSAYPFPSWLDVAVIPRTATPTCPLDDAQATELAPATGGGNIAFAVPEHADVNGNFTAVAGFTPIGPGTALVCAYTNDGSANTLAIASLTLEIRPAAPATVPSSPNPSARLTNLAPPRLTRSHGFLNCGPGHWSGTVSHYAYRWYVGGRLKSNVTANRLHLTGALRGRVLKCAVTATGPSGQSATATSAGARG